VTSALQVPAGAATGGTRHRTRYGPVCHWRPACEPRGHPCAHLEEPGCPGGWLCSVQALHATPDSQPWNCTDTSVCICF